MKKRMVMDTTKILIKKIFELMPSAPEASDRPFINGVIIRVQVLNYKPRQKKIYQPG